MELLYVLGLGLAVWLLLAGLTLVALRWLPVPGLARASALLALTTLLFAFEHGVGLGGLLVLLMPALAGAAFLLWSQARGRGFPPGFVAGEAVFLAALLYGAFWRHFFPGVIDVLDQISDFGLIAAYLRGETLPPVDPWLPTQSLDYYYGLQHYGAALFGRLLGAGTGYVFNGAPVVLSAVVVALAWDFLRAFALRSWQRALLLAVFVLGGTGLAPFFHHLVAPSPALNPWDELIVSSRFVGWLTPEQATAVGRWFLESGTGRPPMQLPIETFGFQYLIGGYHAPLSGFLLLILALATMAWIERLPERRPSLEFVLGASTTLTLACHAWVFPLHAILVGTWKAWDLARRPRGSWRDLPAELLWLAAGAVAVLLLLLPYLAGVAEHGKDLSLGIVAAKARTPLWQFAVLFWPLFALGALALLGHPRRGLAALLVCVFLPLLVGAELLNVTDPDFWGSHARFNPALKWWGWIFTGLLLAGGAMALAAQQRWVRAATVVVLLAVGSYAVDVVRWAVLLDHRRAGQWDGLAIYGADPTQRRIVEFLAAAPQGQVLQAVYDERPIDSGIYAGFALQRSVVGVPWILHGWRDGLTELDSLVAEVQSFYAGTHPAPLEFLRANDARYVLWMPREAKAHAEVWDGLRAALAPEYLWLEFAPEAGEHAGVWRRAD